MGRAVIWTVVAVAVAALAWFLIGEDGSDPRPGGYDPFANLPGSNAEGEEGPGLQGREGAPLLETEKFEGGEAAIHGIVLDEEGRPLGGIRVTASPRPKNIRQGNVQNRRSAVELFEPPPGLGKVVADATTKADGQFVIEGLKEADRYHIRADVAAPRYSSSTDWSATLVKRWTVRIIVGEGSALRGRVVDADGNGLLGWVQVSKQGNIGKRAWISGRWRVPSFSTRPDGRFTLDAVPSGTLLFKVTVLGRGSRANIPVDTPTDEEVQLAFESPSGATVNGTVSDTKGRPIADARITVRSAPERLGGFSPITTRAAKSGKDGRFEVVRNMPGVIQAVLVYAEGYVIPGSMGGGMPLTKDKPTTLDIILAKGAVIEGTVVDPEGKPIAGAEVQATRTHSRWGGWFQMLATGVSGADGRYRLVDVPIGSGMLHARAEGYYQPKSESAAANPFPWMQTPEGVPFDASAEGQLLEKEVKLAPGVAVKGRVEHEDGRGVAGATVTLTKMGPVYWYGGMNQRRNPSTRSAEDGSFELTGIAPEKSYNAVARTETHLSEPVKTDVPKEGSAKPLKIVVKEGGSVAGKVIEADGTPVVGATVTCNQANVSANTDAKGLYLIQGIKAGAWTVQVGNMNPLPDTAKQSGKVDWGERIDGIDLTMPATLSIKGVVEDLDGKPLTGIGVRARRIVNTRETGHNYHATTDTKGAFEIRRVPEGRYRVYAGKAKEDGVAAGDTDVRLVYQEPDRVTVEGKVLDPDGNPVARGTARVWTGKGGKRNSQKTATITGGYFRARVTTIENAVDIDVSAAFDALGRPLNFMNERSKNLDYGSPIEIRLSRGLEISGRVVDDGGRGLLGIQIRAGKKGNRSYGFNPYGGPGSARTSEDGSFKIGALKEGEYELTITPGGEWMTPDPVPARAGDTDVVIRLGKGLTIEGRVLDADGGPIAGANVWLSETKASKASRGAKKNPQNWMQQFRMRTQAKPDGSFRITGLPERALFDVWAGGNGPDQPFISESIKDVAAGSKDIELSLREGVLIEGEIVGPKGEPVMNGWLQANPIDSKSGLKSAHGNLNGQSNKFKVGPLMPGRYRLTVQVHGGGLANPEPMEVDAPARGLRLVAGTTQKVTGRLLGSDVKGFYVMFQQKGQTQSGTTSGDGSFTINNVKNSKGTLYAYKPGDDRYARLKDVDINSGPFTLSLQEGMTIEGFIDGWTETKQRPNVYCQTSGIWIAGKVNEDGSWRITGLPPGKYTIHAWAQGGSIQQVKDIEAGSRDVALTFKPSG